MGTRGRRARRGVDLRGQPARHDADPAARYLAPALELRPLPLEEPWPLDAAARRVRSFSSALAGRGIHDARDVTAIAGEVLVLEEGRIVQRGTHAEPAARAASEVVAGHSDSAPGAAAEAG